MSIEGWAYSSHLKQEDFYSRYKYLKDKGVYLYIESVTNSYAQKTYRGKVIDGSDIIESVRDIGLICDSGNLCFGGRGNLKEDGEFTFVVYTD
ncbi:hypothetical protein [Oceanobacillus sp. FSL H7-0719]|uniref:hypothetical protein n=1 Tax=Oceanobacillus sp. FSL H7-0719 TaxID=2954507 RepID=UPI00325658EE